MAPVAELLLFSAARAQLVREKLAPALRNGIVVIADRFYDSTTAYQGYGRGIAIESIDALNGIATDGLAPDITFFLDITVEESLNRRTRAGTIADRMEKADRDFHERVRQGYHMLSTRYGDRFIRVDGAQPETTIAETIAAVVRDRLSIAAGKEGQE
jgi:dTMP kinase